MPSISDHVNNLFCYWAINLAQDFVTYDLFLSCNDPEMSKASARVLMGGGGRAVDSYIPVLPD